MGRLSRLPGISEGNTRRRNLLVGIGYGFVGLAALGAILPEEESDADADQSGSGSGTPTPTSTPTPTPTATATPTPTPGVQERYRQQLLSETYGLGAAGIDTVREIDVVSHEQGQVIEARVRPETYLDAVDIARTGVSNGYVVARAAFELFDDVAEVNSFTLAEFTDQAGNTEEDTAVKTHLTAETAADVDWEGLRDLVIRDYRNYLQLVDGYDIHLAVCEQLDFYPNCAK